MLTSEHLCLGSISLKGSEEWKPASEGLTFVVPREGEGQYAKGPAAQRLGVGDVLVLTTGVDGPVRSATGRKLVFWSVTVCFEHLLPLFATPEIPLLQGVMEAFRRSRLYPAGTAVAETCCRLLEAVPAELGMEHRSQVLRAASVILSAELKNAKAQHHGYVGMEEQMHQRFEALALNDLLHLSVDELAAKFNCSRRHLNRLFHQHFGLPVATLRMELRLLKAVSLLRDPTAKVINVAENCGFNHLGLFNTCFKRRFGVSPGQWRKQAQESPELAQLANPQANPFCQRVDTPAKAATASRSTAPDSGALPRSLIDMLPRLAPTPLAASDPAANRPRLHLMAEA